ncbi:protein phosphatase 2C domain-containing protein [Streptomyces gardneri]|uniref:PP2C family protein-serine/threonine phosphatase n=1 Tax=Nocardia TaxID=1817 RepID=UPI0013570F6F|nr:MULTISPECIES: protein phosphatase 2C domain-containing protein [Nocardia]MBF6167108.1 protein phosphatase 2C domain-containing protein [Streptomyces gardneri]MBF6204155.1 protein phosphatase 2C domain-containing protein [Streptomyces gardneri]UAK30639.1 protein phosphatase 2C domain-containing protein [Nocardia asteroides]
MSDEGADLRCAGCSAVGLDSRRCASCGLELGYRYVALPGHDPTPCAECGADRFDTDGRCAQCGRSRAVPDRFDTDLGAVAVLTDRGIVHARNEDAVAAGVLQGVAPEAPSAVVIAVSDGVSTSSRPQVASGAAVRAGVGATAAALATGSPAAEAIMAGLAAAAQAVREVDVPDGPAPSCTYVSAIVAHNGAGTEITVANVGDSRAYWLPAGPGGEPAQRLSVDDSWAQALVDAGAMDERAAMADPRAHTLIRWLGADSPPTPWADNCVRTMRTSGPGMLLLCSDGLWNYSPSPSALAEQVAGASPAQAARMLAEFALRCGGGDNITVALAPIPWESGSPVP